MEGEILGGRKQPMGLSSDLFVALCTGQAPESRLPTLHVVAASLDTYLQISQPEDFKHRHNSSQFWRLKV